jgi:hypothetical protein
MIKRTLKSGETIHLKSFFSVFIPGKIKPELILLCLNVITTDHVVPRRKSGEDDHQPSAASAVCGRLLSQQCTGAKSIQGILIVFLLPDMLKLVITRVDYL